MLENATLATWVEAILTLMVLSYLWKDNPVFRFAQHLTIGISASYVALYYHESYIKPVFEKTIPEEGKYYLLFGALLGLMMYLRYFPSVAWVARIPMGFLVGYGAGFILANNFSPFLTQVTGAFRKFTAYYPETSPVNPGGLWAMKTVWNVVWFVMLVSTLIYFFFTVKRDNPIIRSGATFGRWTIMLALGAAFGTTTMARITLFWSRLQFLLLDWLKLGAS